MQYLHTCDYSQKVYWLDFSKLLHTSLARMLMSKLVHASCQSFFELFIWLELANFSNYSANLGLALLVCTGLFSDVSNICIFIILLVEYL